MSRGVAFRGPGDDPGYHVPAMRSPNRERRRDRRRPLALVALALIATLALPVVGPPGAAPAALAGRTTQSISGGFVAGAREQIAPAVSREVGTITTDRSGSQVVNIVDVATSDPALTFEASLSNDEALGRQTVRAQALSQSSEGHRVIVAINGDVWGGYTSASQDAPNGIHVHEGELMIAGNFQRPSFAIDASGRPMVGTARVELSATGLDGMAILVDRLNQLRKTGEIAAYTYRFGPATPKEASGVEAVLGGILGPLPTSGTVVGTVLEIRPAGSQPLVPGQLVINGAATTFVNRLAVGEQVTFSISITPGWEGVRELVSGRETIVRDGQAYVSPRTSIATQMHPRSAIGTTANGDVVIATVDGRDAGTSTGVDLDELAQLMLVRGAVQAINLDGGGSTTLVLRRPGDVDASVVNRPSDGAERAVANAILLVSSAPTGPPASLLVSPAAPQVYQGESVVLAAKAVDASLNGIPVDPSGVSWSLASGPGTLAPDGRYTAADPGTATVSASAIGLTAQISVTTLTDTSPPTFDGGPVSRLTEGTKLSTTGVPLTVSWPAATDRGTGVAQYELQRSMDGGKTWDGVKLSAPAKTSAAVLVTPGKVTRMRVRATDKAGNVGGWETGLRFRVVAYQDTSTSVGYRGSWKNARSASLFGGSSRWTSNGSAKLSFQGSQVAWVSIEGPDRGAGRVLVDGKSVASVDNRASTRKIRTIVYVRLFEGLGRHTIEVKALGTSGRPRIDLDAFVIVVPIPD
jgi:hypothetical protein